MLARRDLCTSGLYPLARAGARTYNGTCVDRSMPPLGYSVEEVRYTLELQWCKNLDQQVL